jgi:hypothetical protein
MFSVQSMRDRGRCNDRMTPALLASEDCSPQPPLATKDCLGQFLRSRMTPATPVAGLIDPVTTFDFRATEFGSRNPDTVAFTIKASQHLRQRTKKEK